MVPVPVGAVLGMGARVAGKNFLNIALCLARFVDRNHKDFVSTDTRDF